MTTRRPGPLAALTVTLALALLPGSAAGENGAEPPPTASEPAHPCLADQQQCSAGPDATWCCPRESNGAYVCCGAVAGVCNACDVDDPGDELPPPRR
jgi:hypothetical protein